MSSVFPQLSNFHSGVKKTILSRKGNNIKASQMMAWVRLVGAGGLVMESFPNKYNPDDTTANAKNYSTDSFSARYGNGSKSGRVGTDLAGKSIYAEGNDRAYRPSPTIESLNIENGAQGLSRKCTFQIKCYSLGQAEAVSKYYSEPGYTVLVEFGWNMANSLKYKAKPLDICEIASYNNYTYINNKRRDSEGTYDAFLGYITGGGMGSGDGETYLIDVELTTLGEMPAYLQQHKGDAQEKDSENNGSKTYNVSEIQGDADKDNIGLALAKQMFNRLPAQKQTQQVKNLLENGFDKIGTPWSSAHNFINMDDELREKLGERYSDVGVYTQDGKGGAEIPDGAPLFSDQSYIRLELAFEILNTLSYALDNETKCGANIVSFKSRINTDDTICRAFPNMFSIDKSILLIPNEESPSFGLVNALSSTEPITNFVKIEKGVLTSDRQNTNFAKIWGVDNASEYAFPARKALPATEGLNNIDSTVRPQTSKKGTWGYLRNLYLNFDFFIQVLNKSNYVSKDIYYEILNSISTAANSYWYFEICQNPNKDNGCEELVIRDLSFTGDVPKSLIDQATSFYSKGIDTPFLTSQLKFDIPGAMKNHVLGARLSEGDDEEQNINTITDGQVPNVKGLFSTRMDPVIAKLNSLKPKDPPDENKPPSTPDKPDEDEIRAKNYEIFIGKACIMPTLNDRNEIPNASKSFLGFLRGISEGYTSIENLAVISAWSDASIFSLIELKCSNEAGKNPMILPIEFEFEIHGISGIRVGDIFKIVDLPTKYKNGIFQVVETSHVISGTQWKTTVKGKFRNIT